MTDDEVRRRFEAGLRRGRDPANLQLEGRARTTVGSPWWAIERCPVCRHTFRLGDEVWVSVDDGRLTVRHDSVALSCHTGRVAGGPPVESEAVVRFYSALDDANPPPPGIKVARLGLRDPIFDPRRPVRLQCAGCPHTFRPYEVVAFCPCSPESPKCKLRAHRDPGSGLICFDALIGDKRGVHCKMSFRQIGPAGNPR